MDRETSERCSTAYKGNCHGLTSTETIRFIRDGERGGGGGRGGMEVGEEGDYIHIATLSPSE